jgi:hypothetical protein
LSLRPNFSLGGVLALVWLAWPVALSAEPYVAAYVGAAFSQNKDLETSLELNGTSFLDGEARNLKFETSLLFGGKVGYFFEGRASSGPTSAWRRRASTSSRTSASRPRASSAPWAAVAADRQIRVQQCRYRDHRRRAQPALPVAVAVRDEFPHGRLQPYLGVGLAVLIAELSTTTTPFDVNKSISDTNVQPALQVLAGLRMLVTLTSPCSPSTSSSRAGRSRSTSRCRAPSAAGRSPRPPGTAPTSPRIT